MCHSLYDDGRKTGWKNNNIAHSHGKVKSPVAKDCQECADVVEDCMVDVDCRRHDQFGSE